MFLFAGLAPFILAIPYFFYLIGLEIVKDPLVLTVLIIMFVVTGFLACIIEEAKERERSGVLDKNN